ncbi:MAG: hypothetical protein ACOYNY_01415 [Caldilineaceae bacterium]
MSFQEKNIAVSLVNFSLILVFYLFRLWQLIGSARFEEAQIFRLWMLILVAAIVVTIVATILTQIGAGIIEGIKTKAKPVIEEITDERDKLIDLKGTKTTYTLSSIGTFLAMLTFALGQPPLVMFTLLIGVGLLAQIIGDGVRLYFYRRGV